MILVSLSPPSPAGVLLDQRELFGQECAAFGKLGIVRIFVYRNDALTVLSGSIRIFDYLEPSPV